ncbi:MAG: nucleotide-binding protein [Abitibacteriaceae bacterium]|nr:nucleotide-binding protein [Abditibacteriaceae bacterium]
MIDRFEGPDGNRHLITVLQQSSLVEHQEAVAKRLAELGSLVAVEKDKEFITQGNSDNDIYFILSGQADVFVNNRHIGTREVGDAVGEMSITEPAQPRSATLIARTPVVLLKISEPDFQQIVAEFPSVWKAVAQTLTKRLRKRGDFLNLPNTRPLLFLGCSTETLEVVREIQSGLQHDNIEVTVWTDGVFSGSSVTVDGLLDTVKQTDFAAFVFSPDDKTISRKGEFDAPRDNVVFELGLFMGQLERSRTFIIKEYNSDVKIPTDLLGINPIAYRYSKGDNLTTAIAPVCNELRKVVRKLGTR